MPSLPIPFSLLSADLCPRNLQESMNQNLSPVQSTPSQPEDKESKTQTIVRNTPATCLHSTSPVPLKILTSKKSNSHFNFLSPHLHRHGRCCGALVSGAQYRSTCPEFGVWSRRKRRTRRGYWDVLWEITSPATLKEMKYVNDRASCHNWKGRAWTGKRVFPS